MRLLRVAVVISSALGVERSTAIEADPATVANSDQR